MGPYPESFNLDVDCVIANGVVSEMHPYSLKYVLRQAHRWMSISSGQKILYIGGAGDTRVANTFDNVLDDIQSVGFDRRFPEVGSDEPFYFFSPRY